MSSRLTVPPPPPPLPPRKSSSVLSVIDKISKNKHNKKSSSSTSTLSTKFCKRNNLIIICLVVIMAIILIITLYSLKLLHSFDHSTSKTGYSKDLVSRLRENLNSVWSLNNDIKKLRSDDQPKLLDDGNNNNNNNHGADGNGAPGEHVDDASWLEKRKKSKQNSNNKARGYWDKQADVEEVQQQQQKSFFQKIRDSILSNQDDPEKRAGKSALHESSSKFKQLVQLRHYNSDDDNQHENNISALPVKFFHSSPNNGKFKPACERVAGEEVLAETWANSARIACVVDNAKNGNKNKGGNVKVEEHLIDHIDGRPSFRFYENVYLSSYAGGFEGTDCPRNSYLIGENGKKIENLDWARPMPKSIINALDDPSYLNKSFVKKKDNSNNNNNNNNNNKPQEADLPPALSNLVKGLKGGNDNNDKQITLERFGYDDPELIMVRIVRFMVGNAYDSIHSYINSYLMFKAFGFNQTKVQWVFEDKKESCLRDDQFWNAITLNQRPPIYKFVGTDGLEHTRRKENPNQVILARRAVQGFSTGISVLSTATPPLGGKARDHHCSSSLAQNSIKWMRENFVKVGMLPPRQQPLTPRTTGGKIEVIWNSRQIHPRAGGKLLLPHRMMAREASFVLALRTALGPDFKLRVVDFGKLDGPESIAAAETGQVMIGCHGAGLTWGMYMQPSQSAIVEIFGGNRPSSNKHYMSISKLMDFNYRPLTIPTSYETAFDWYRNVEGERRGFGWDQGFVNQIANTIHSLPWVPTLRRRRACHDS